MTATETTSMVRQVHEAALASAALGVVEVGDIDDIARGAAVLGAGGGGDPYLGSLLAKHALETHGPVELVSPYALPDDALVLPVAMMGAPAVIVEKTPSGDEFTGAFELVAARLGRPVTHVACLEVGGLNSMTPIVTAARLGLPLVDGDGMGRAFPEIQMVLFTVDGISSSPMAMADEKGNTVLLSTVDNVWAERIARSTTVDMGCSASVALYPHTGAQARSALVPHTLSLAATIGRLVRRARADHVDAAVTLAHELGGEVLMRGKVTDVSRRTVGGFTRGQATVAGQGGDSGSTLTVDFQNENLIARRDGHPVATVPDLVTMLDAETGQPITTEQLRFGFRVSVLALPCHPRWRTPAALELVGPGAFGYDVPYVPVGRRR